MRRNRILKWRIAVPLCGTLLCATVLRAGTGTEDHPAVESFRLAEYKMAEKQFRAELAENPADAFLEYGLGLTELLRADRDHAEEGLKMLHKMAETYPESEYAPWALLECGRYYQLTQDNAHVDYSKARAEYRKVCEKYPDSDAAREAFLYEHATYIANGTREEIQATVSALKAEVSKLKEDNFYIASYYKLLAHAYERIGNYKDSLPARIREVDAMKRNTPNNDRAALYWAIASIAQYKVGDFATAREFFHRLKTEYPQDARNFGANLALRKMDALEKELLEEINAEIRTNEVKK